MKKLNGLRWKDYQEMQGKVEAGTLSFNHLAVPNRLGSLAYARDVRMVEAVGVEPTSENVTGQEPTYLSEFTRRELPRHIRALR